MLKKNVGVMYLKESLQVVEFLAKHNETFCGKSSKLYTENNSTFLGLVKTVAKLVLIMANHLK